MKRFELLVVFFIMKRFDVSNGSGVDKSLSVTIVKSVIVCSDQYIV